MKFHRILALLVLSATCQAADENKPSPLGYEDTPLIPGTEWRVHDLNRPRPKVVAPGKTASDAPADAVVLFDGKSTDAFVGKEGAPCPWKIENGELVIYNGDVWTKESFGDCQIHLEWQSQPETKGNSQKKGNSGIFIQDLYEVQILDCYNNPTYADGHSGSVYGQTPALVNAVRPPGNWQVYDVLFTAPKQKDGKVVEPAYVTVIINGIVVQNHTAIMGPTKHKQATSYEGLTLAAKAPIRFQDHKNDPPVKFRNIWIRPL